MSSAPTTGRVFWVTGLAGTGKSTLGRHLADWLRSRGTTAVLLDGDVVRDLVLEDRGHDRASRLRIARFNGRLCRLLAEQGVDVVCATISLFHECQAWNRRHLPDYVEIFLDAPIDVLVARDPTSLVARAKRGEVVDVVGVDLAAELPLTPDIVFDAAAPMPPEAMVVAVAQWLSGPPA